MTESAWSVGAIARDRSHGSTYLSIRALEILQAQARSPNCTWDDLVALARELVDVRPSMVVIANRVHRVMHVAKRDVRDAEREARKTIDRAERADGRAAENAAELVHERRVLTFSRSETVTDALVLGRPAWVGVPESRPGGEGTDVAEHLRRSGLAVSELPDAAMASIMIDRHVEVVLVGADAVLPSGAVVNKVGTRLLALAAREEHVPMYSACAEDKISAGESLALERAGESEVPLFEVTPHHLFTAIVTDNGVMKPQSVSDVARQLKRFTAWMAAG